MANVKSLINKQIRLDIITRILWRNRKKFILPLSLTAVITYALMCCIPRYYSVKVMLAPEYDSGSSGSSLSSLASLANIKLGGLGSNSDALVPTFYPDLMKSTDFVVPLFEAKVSTLDGTFKGSLTEYLTQHQDAPWWGKAMVAIKNLVSSKQESGRIKGEKVNPFQLSKSDMMLAEIISASISCSVDKKPMSSPSQPQHKIHWLLRSWQIQ